MAHHIRLIFARRSSIFNLRIRPPAIRIRSDPFSSRTRPDPSTFIFRPDKVEIIDEIDQDLDDRTIRTARRHPGVLRTTVTSVETDLQKAFGRILVDKGDRLSTYKQHVIDLDKFLRNRHLPVEPYDVDKLRADIERRLREKLAKKGITHETFETDEERREWEKNIGKKTDYRVKVSTPRWNAIKFDTRFKCMTYGILRFAAEYAALRRVFNEIVKRAPEFTPRHVFDFGTGLGTTFFAAENAWSTMPVSSNDSRSKSADIIENNPSSPSSIKSSVDEYFCVDPCDEMCDVFRLLLRDGVPNGDARHPNVTFRSYLPATNERRYDLVVSAYSLFELPSYEERMRTVANLWLKTDQFLVLIERGTNAGYRAIIEARDYVLAGAHEIYRKALPKLATEHDVDLRAIDSIIQRQGATESEKFRQLRDAYPGVDFPSLLPHGHVFAPCPHDMGCPRLMDTTPCNFNARYFPLRLSGGVRQQPAEEVFSYVILRKGYAPPNHEDRWPRIVREPRKSSQCIWCQTCTPRGVLEEKAFHSSKKRGDRRKQFDLVKRSSWGDLLPMVSTYDRVDSSGEAAAAASEATEDESEDDDTWVEEKAEAELGKNDDKSPRS